MRPLLDYLKSASAFPAAMAAFLWLLSIGGTDRQVSAALLMTVVASISIYFEFIHSPRDSDHRD